METHVVWNQQSQSLLKYLYENMKIYNWTTIAAQLTQRLGQNFTRDGCLNRYTLISNPVPREEWAPEEQQQLYRLHNQNGNKWATIASNLLGRTDNCVKNHFYSKLRKSLRTLNKIGKMYLKKCVKEVSNTVLYKLTEATDQSLKQNPQISQQIINLCFDLKFRLLNYDVDQKDIRDGFDYSFQKNLLFDLAAFSRVYKKKSKKQKNSAMGSQNLKKLHEKKRKQKQFKVLSQNMFSHHDIPSPSQDDPNDNLNPESFRALSEASSVFPKVAKTVVLKAPTVQPLPKIQHIPQNHAPVKIQELFSPLFPKQAQTIRPIQSIQTPSQNPNLMAVQNILRTQGVLEQGDDQRQNYNAINFFRRQGSNRSFSSVRSISERDQYSNFDMFGGDSMMNSRFKEINGMEQDNNFFGNESSNNIPN